MKPTHRVNLIMLCMAVINANSDISDFTDCLNCIIQVPAESGRFFWWESFSGIMWVIGTVLWQRVGDVPCIMFIH